ncbi:alpha-D-ribose 1-methylphosphonate 5-triphosphate diphosphatase [Burkholderia cepacia]|uniref:alpha-D-ribose 1-methylphosphonate 5-triphosphate diphosphatase n=1 Tax=Burkholderia cepacia TaxID=292 RepID=UPI002AB74BD7|nr:alpha-D-ribose 1-methylphosphonate 5-triphosphate diphosphatase [Burkholderia cepacia]
MQAQENSVTLGNARIVTPDSVITGNVEIVDGRIARIFEGETRDAVDCQGDYILPGLIDVHTDHFEKHAIPRAGVVWNLVTAACSHDAAMIAAGTTTVFDSLLAGGAGNTARRNLLIPAVDALNTAAEWNMLRADHLLHLRCDIVERSSIELARKLIDHPKLRFVTFIDDEPARDPERAVMVHERRRGLPKGSLTMPFGPTEEEDFDSAQTRRAALIDLCESRGIRAGNHDDTKASHVADAARLGLKISEFPITMEAALAAKAAGMTVICGAPNLVRGGSHTGNVAVAELLHAGLVDILSSDYIPASILQAIFLLTTEAFGWTLPDAVALATRRPAGTFGLTDRGSIEPGLQADLIRVRLNDGIPAIHTVWRAGHPVISTPLAAQADVVSAPGVAA